MELVDSVVQLALLYGIPAIAIAFSFRVIGFADLTPDGAFTLGAAVSFQVLGLGFGLAPALLSSVVVGAAAGIATTLLHTRLGVSKLLSGILMMMALYSVSLRVMGSANVPVETGDILLGRLPAMSATLTPIALLGLFCLTAFATGWSLLQTRLGLMLRATGDSEHALRLKNINLEPRYLVGLAFSNSLVAAAGGMVAVYQGFADVSMGMGLVIAGLTAIIIGETVLRPAKVALLLAAPVLGMVVYQSILGLALRAGIVPGDLKLLTAFLAVLFVAVDRLRSSGPGLEIGNRSI